MSAVSDDIAHFLSQGGKIQRLPQGELADWRAAEHQRGPETYRAAGVTHKAVQAPPGPATGVRRASAKLSRYERACAYLAERPRMKAMPESMVEQTLRDVFRLREPMAKRAIAAWKGRVP